MICIEADLGHYEIIRRFAAVSSSYLEIGVREGESLRAALESHSIERLLLCDTWGKTAGGTNRGSHDHISALLDALGYKRQVEFLDQKSQLVQWKAMSSWWDLVNIDGGHEYAEALADMNNLWPLTRRAMVVHDISLESVWKAVLKFGSSRTDAIAHCAFGDQGTIVFEKGGI